MGPDGREGKRLPSLMALLTVCFWQNVANYSVRNQLGMFVKSSSAGAWCADRQPGTASARELSWLALFCPVSV